MGMPRPDEAAKEYFESIVPDEANVTVRPMFGNVAGFVNGNMFIGLYGNDVFVRLSETERSELLSEAGAAVLEPMPGRPMKEYVTLPSEWRNAPGKVRAWVDRSLQWTAAMPEKKKKPRKRKK